MEARSFAEGDKVEIDDGSGVMRAGTVTRAPGDSYLVTCADGACWVGVHQIFEPGEKVLASDPALPSGPVETGRELDAAPTDVAPKVGAPVLIVHPSDLRTPIGQLNIQAVGDAAGTDPALAQRVSSEFSGKGTAVLAPMPAAPEMKPEVASDEPVPAETDASTVETPVPPAAKAKSAKAKSAKA